MRGKYRKWQVGMHIAKTFIKKNLTLGLLFIKHLKRKKGDHLFICAHTFINAVFVRKSYNANHF